MIVCPHPRPTPSPGRRYDHKTRAIALKIVDNTHRIPSLIPGRTCATRWTKLKMDDASWLTGTVVVHEKHHKNVVKAALQSEPVVSADNPSHAVFRFNQVVIGTPKSISGFGLEPIVDRDAPSATGAPVRFHAPAGTPGGSVVPVRSSPSAAAKARLAAARKLAEDHDDTPVLVAVSALEHCGDDAAMAAGWLEQRLHAVDPSTDLQLGTITGCVWHRVCGVMAVLRADN